MKGPAKPRGFTFNDLKNVVDGPGMRGEPLRPDQIGRGDEFVAEYSDPGFDEPVFTLLGRHWFAPALIEDWIRGAQGSGASETAIVYARKIIEEMRAWQRDPVNRARAAKEI